VPVVSLLANEKKNVAFALVSVSGICAVARGSESNHQSVKFTQVISSGARAESD